MEEEEGLNGRMVKGIGSAVDRSWFGIMVMLTEGTKTETMREDIED